MRTLLALRRTLLSLLQQVTRISINGRTHLAMTLSAGRAWVAANGRIWPSGGLALGGIGLTAVRLW